MITYSCSFLLSKRFWWKNLAKFAKPVVPNDWNAIRTTGILKSYRGKRSGIRHKLRLDQERPSLTFTTSNNLDGPEWKISVEISEDVSNISRNSLDIQTSVESEPDERITHDDNDESLNSQVSTSTTDCFVNFCLWNVQSIKNKTTCFSDYICEKSIDLAVITETWLNSLDSAECLLNVCQTAISHLMLPELIGEVVVLPWCIALAQTFQRR